MGQASYGYRWEVFPIEDRGYTWGALYYAPGESGEAIADDLLPATTREEAEAFAKVRCERLAFRRQRRKDGS